MVILMIVKIQNQVHMIATILETMRELKQIKAGSDKITITEIVEHLHKEGLQIERKEVVSTLRTIFMQIYRSK